MTGVVDFWFDPICPWSWQTSRWMLEVVRLRPVTPRWHVMSLAVLQDNPRLPRAYREMLLEARGPARVCAAARAEHGDEVLGRLYTALGTRFHERGLPQSREVVEDALREAGLPARLSDALSSRTYEEALLLSHKAAVALVGDEAGTPVLALEGPPGTGQAAFFGPVVTPVPRGEDAARLWDGVVLVASTPGFYEIKRSRT
ncbi:MULTISPECIES: DsbA family protein [unclassified Streptomyces]|uniref:mycothiol-dependent nitroreductase Rv2466c family protein n=1 Tax=unclassified Streptomyces TaxID=2593676 RepID=UPI001BE72906|nr:MULTISPECIES: DsbA family protein [unclassified Streptomyces]MBT2405515.1 DsbA family protein [Streptomyces sp. ISL-21]MBT2454433.1 DsbA family protein [Streptomyces sp. ISL-86]MBT2607806.1 DsbA family protein [Streptomyces sp. ISL-87]